MSWKTNLRPASLAGVSFHVHDRDHETGRRIHDHQYPKRDQNFAEDMGRATRQWNVSAYLVGDDYMARRDRLVQVAERAGPLQYIDRWGKSHSVVCQSCQVKETEQEGRYCTVSLKLIAAGSAPSAEGIVSALAQIGGAAEALTGLGLATFAHLSLPGQLMDLTRAGDVLGTLGAGEVAAKLLPVGVSVDLTGTLRTLTDGRLPLPTRLPTELAHTLRRAG
jgi:hypothetical protein